MPLYNPPLQPANNLSDLGNAGTARTNLGLAAAPLYLSEAPTGATAETCPRLTATAATTVLVTQTLYVMAIGLSSGVAINNITYCVKSTSTGGASITNAWYVLLDSGLVVRAVSGNQNGSSTFMATANTPYTLSVSASAYTTTYSGLYYTGVMVQCGTMPNLASPAGTSGIASALNSATPILAATSSTSQTTPPTTGTTMAALAAANGFIAYAYTS